MSPLFFVFLLPLALLAFAVVAKIWEPRLVWPYAPVDDSAPPTPYTSKAASTAQALDFTRLDVFRDAKGPLYRIRYEFWLAPGRDALLVIGGGSIARIPVSGSLLYTRMSDGRCLVTLDDERASEYDLAGPVEEAVFAHVPLERLVDEHRQRVALTPAPALPYADAIADHRDMMSRRIGALVQLGYAVPHGGAGEGWRYTTRGALASTFSAYWRGLGRGLKRKVTGRP